MKKITRMTFVIIVILVNACAVSMGKTVVAEDGKTEFRIVIPKYSDRSIMAVALDLAAILKESTGALWPVYFDDFTNPGGYEIVIGADNARLKQLGLDGLTDDFAPDEYEIRTQGKYIVIAGAPARGTINGVYGFLQDHLGCRWLTPGCQYVPTAGSRPFAGGLSAHRRRGFRIGTSETVSMSPT